MPQPLETLLYVARLTKAEKVAILAHDAAFPSSGLWSSLREGIEDVCVDRLLRADGCLRMARQLAAPAEADEEALRAAIGRAYYSVHHSLRAMALWQNQWDPDGHEESLKQFKVLLEDNGFRHRSGLAADDYERVAEARTNRHVADYSPYDVQRDPPNTGWIGITNGTWADAAQFNIDLADDVFRGAIRCVGS